MADPPIDQSPAAAEGGGVLAGSSSQEGLVAVSTRSAFYKRQGSAGGGSRAPLLLGALLLLLFCTAVALAIALAIVTYRGYATNELLRSHRRNVCTTNECVRAANNLIQSMDRGQDPCHDFYAFACGRWSEKHPVPDTAISLDWFSERASRMARRIRDFLRENSSPKEAVSVRQARRLYRSCLDVRRLDELGLSPMHQVLRQVGLPLPVPQGAPAPAFQLTDTIARARLLTGRELLVGTGVYPDSRDRRRNRITVTQPDSQSPLPLGSELEKRVHKIRLRTLASAAAAAGPAPGDEPWRASRAPRQAPPPLPQESTLLSSYLRYMTRVMRYAYTWNSTRGSGLDLDALFMAAARRVQALETTLYKLSRPPTNPATIEPQDMTVTELQRMTDIAANGTTPLDWRSLLRRLFRRARNVTLLLDGGRGDRTLDRILVLNAPYVRNVAAVLANVDRVVLQNYLWWVMVETLSPHLDRTMQDLKVKYLEEVTDSHMPPSRSLFCASAVNHMMGMAVSVMLTQPLYLNTTGQRVEEMLSDVRAAFRHRVDELDWMDGATKEATREKAAAMRSLVGFPSWLLDNDSLDAYYAGLEIDDEAYLVSLLRISQLSVSTMLEELRNTNEEMGWVTDPTDVNAFHTFQANTVTVPAGILQFPFYDLGLDVLNYGAIGSILGHELTHGFDDQGRMFDKNGNRRQWWSNATVAEYVSRTECFVRQYSAYELQEIADKVDGRLTLGENIADNGGLREALKAYELHRERRQKEPEPVLPGLEEYTWQQLFFLSFANVWCEAYTEQSLRYDVSNEHSPNPIRVRGVLANMGEFADAWDCPRGSAMNPDSDRCVIW